MRTALKEQINYKKIEILNIYTHDKFKVMANDNTKSNNDTTNTIFNKLEKNASGEARCSSSSITRSTFPSANELKTQLYEKNFNRALNIIYAKINDANNSAGNPTTIRLLNTDFNNGSVGAQCVPPSAPVPPAVPNPVPVSANNINIPTNVIVDVKKFLVDKGYTIAETENADGMSIGWRLSW